MRLILENSVFSVSDWLEAYIQYFNRYSTDSELLLYHFLPRQTKLDSWTRPAQLVFLSWRIFFSLIPQFTLDPELTVAVYEQMQILFFFKIIESAFLK